MITRIYNVNDDPNANHPGTTPRANHPGSSVICTGLRYLGGAHTADRPRLSSKFKVDFSVSVSCTIVHPERREGATLHFCIHIHHDHKLIFSWIPSFSEWSTYVCSNVSWLVLISIRVYIFRVISCGCCFYT